MNGDCKYKEQGVCCNTASEWLADFPAKEDCRKCGYYGEKKDSGLYKYGLGYSTRETREENQ